MIPGGFHWAVPCWEYAFLSLAVHSGSSPSHSARHFRTLKGVSRSPTEIPYQTIKPEWLSTFDPRELPVIFLWYSSEISHLAPGFFCRCLVRCSILCTWWPLSLASLPYLPLPKLHPGPSLIAIYQPFLKCVWSMFGLLSVDKHSDKCCLWLGARFCSALFPWNDLSLGIKYKMFIKLSARPLGFPLFRLNHVTIQDNDTNVTLWMLCPPGVYVWSHVTYHGWSDWVHVMPSMASNSLLIYCAELTPNKLHFML